jgi:hypothetical protein
MAEIELDKARRVVAAAERAKENLEKARQIIEAIYGLKTEYGRWYEIINPPAVELRLLSPTNQTLVNFEMSWDDEGYVIPDRVRAGKSPVTGLDDVKIAIAKLAPRGHTFRYKQRYG